MAIKTKKQALADLLECKPRDIIESEGHGRSVYHRKGQDEHYLVVTRDELDQICENQARQGLNVFNVQALIDFSNGILTDDHFKMVEALVEECPGRADEILKEMIDVEGLVQRVLETDGVEKFVQGHHDEVGSFHIFANQ